LQLEIEKPVMDGHRHGRAVEGIGDGTLKVVESGLDDCTAAARSPPSSESTGVRVPTWGSRDGAAASTRKPS
jgi:hypothetical protein